jgi:K+-sensing histidine kinase KdpD
MRRSKRPWYRRMFQASVLDRLLRALPDVDVLVVASDRPA